MGWDYAIDLFGVGKCGQYGDNTAEKPSFIDVVATIKWDAWSKYNGVPSDLCKKMFLEKGQAMMEKFGHADKIPDPNRPGPDYYKNCIKFNWVDALVAKHKKFIKLSNGEDVYSI